jgi:hypothetical protein
MITGFYQAKHGQRCTTTTCMVALRLTGSVLVVDPHGDCAATLGVAEVPVGERREVTENLSLHRTTVAEFPYVDVSGFTHVLVDCGTDDMRVDQRYIVTVPCYLALRRGVASDVKFDGIILQNEPGRALTATDVSRALGGTVIAQVPFDPGTSRLVDAGLMGMRPPRNIDLDDLLIRIQGASL